jgi:hypothetical protein
MALSEMKGRFFAVKFSTTIHGVRYIPSVCYPLSTGLYSTIEEMATKGMAKIFIEKVRFVTGVPYPVGSADVSSSVSAPQVRTEPVHKQPSPKLTGSSSTGKSTRRTGKNAFTSQTHKEYE